MSDDKGTGKPCPLCSTPMVGIGTHQVRECVGCHTTHPWQLDEGQKPLLNSSRGDKKQ